MANQVSNFQFQNNALRVIVVNGEPWFLAADVCRIIGITSPTKAVKILDDDEVALKTFQGLTNGNDEANFISESGMYKIVMRSQDAIKQGTPAHAFTKWVTSEVLPAIRKTGSYSVSISKAQQGELATLIAERFPSGKDRPCAWSRFNNHFRLASYKDLPTNRFEEACEYIKTMPEQIPALPRPAVNLLDKDYFAKVRDIAIKFADDWVRVGKGEDVQPTLTIPDDVLAGIIAQQISRQNFRLYVDYAGHLNVDPIPNKSPYEGLAEAIADPGNIGLADEVIEEIGAACVKALAYRAQSRKSVIGKIRGTK
jgi:prophage antirepressor-like protein